MTSKNQTPSAAATAGLGAMGHAGGTIDGISLAEFEQDQALIREFATTYGAVASTRSNDRLTITVRSQGEVVAWATFVPDVALWRSVLLVGPFGPVGDDFATVGEFLKALCGVVAEQMLKREAAL